MEQQFCLGEYVESVADKRVGVVKKVEPIKILDDFLYTVEFIDRRKDELRAVDITPAWRRYVRIHAHVTTSSRDCDGQYSAGHTDVPNTDERTSQFGDILFKERVVCSAMSLHGHGSLNVTPEQVQWTESTDEGFRRAEITWCDDGGCVGKSWQRDHSAEAAGY